MSTEAPIDRVAARRKRIAERSVDLLNGAEVSPSDRCLYCMNYGNYIVNTDVRYCREHMEKRHE